MSTRHRLESMLTTDPRDPGCGEVFELIHAYAQHLLDGRDPEQEMPGVAVHLAQCGPCAEDFLGLLAALEAEDR